MSDVNLQLKYASLKMLYNGEPSPVLCEDLVGWDGEKRGPGERGYIYIYIYIYTHLWLIHITVKQKPIQHCKLSSNLKTIQFF